MTVKDDETMVILDTNAILGQFSSSVDILGELDRLLGAYEIVIPSSIHRELDCVSDRYAKAARKFAQRFRTIPTELSGDESILKLAEDLKALVVTNDKELRKRLRKRGLTSIFMRQGKYLSIDRP
jgi:rRNA-processing protein FCF1